MKIRNKKTGEIREVSMNELNQYGLGGQHNKLVKYKNKGEVKSTFNPYQQNKPIVDRGNFSNVEYTKSDQIAKKRQNATNKKMYPSVVRTKKDLITNRENVPGDSFTGTMRREALAYLPYFKDAMKYLEKGASYITPDYKSQADRELLFKRHRPVAYPNIADAGIDLLKNYSHSLFNTPIKEPFIDPEGDYDAPEEAWRMALGLPVKNKYIIPSKYRPLNEEDKTSKYYTLREDMYHKDLLRQKIKELKIQPGQSVVLPSFAPFVNESYMSQKQFSDVDPLQNFKIGVNKNGKMYFYDKYDFDFEPLSKVTRPYEYEFYNELKTGGEMIKRADGSYSRRGLWDNIRANAGSGKRPTKEMLNQERKIRNQYQDGGEEEVYWRTKQPMVNDPSMDAISKVLLQRNIDKNFIQRAAGFGNQNGIPTKYIDGQDPDSNNMSNLLMGFGDNYVSPTIIETFPNFLGNNSTMLRTAPGQLSYQPNQIQEYIKTPTVDIADYFATKGYKRAANDMYGMNYKKGGSVTLNAGGENHRIYVKTTNRGEGDKGHIMVNHPTMDKGMWDTIDLTKKSGATTIAQGVAATKKWHMENPYMKKYGGQPTYAYGGLVKYKEGEEVKKAEQQNVAPLVDQKSKLIFRNPVLETPCEGIGCAQLTSNELSKMNLIPSRTDAWFMGDAVVKDGGKQIWNRQSGNIDYSTLIPGDIITLDRPGYAHQSEMRNNNPVGYNPEREVEHVGVIVGHDERGVPLVKHGGNHGIRTVIQPIDKLSLYIPDSGATLEYKPFAIYRTKGAENIPIPDSYYNKQFAEFDNNTPLLKKQLNNTEKQNKMIDAFNNNLEKQSRVLNLNPYDIQQLQKIAFGIFGNESKFGTSPIQKPKEYVKRFGHFIRADKWAPFVDDETSPSLSEMRIKYGDIYGDGNSKISNQFDELGIKEKNLKGYNSDNDYNDEANAAVAILVNNYNKIKNDKDEYGRSKYNYDPTKQTVYGDIPVTEVIAKMYNSGPGIINNENKLRKKFIYGKQAIENAYINFDEVPSLTKTFKNDVIISGGLKKPITKPLINTTPEMIIPENINPRFMYSTPPSVFANGGDVPMYGPGGFVAKPTASDSLAVMNSALAVQKYYDNLTKKGWYKEPIVTRKGVNEYFNPTSLNEIEKESLETYTDHLNRPSFYMISTESVYPKVTENDIKKKAKQSILDIKNKKPNTYIYKDLAPTEIDEWAPPTLIDMRIKPQTITRYVIKKNDYMVPGGGYTDIMGYDPIAVKPAAMKTAADWAYMQKTYGTKPPATTTPKPTTTKTVITTKDKVTTSVRPKYNLKKLEFTMRPLDIPIGVPHGELIPITPMTLPQQGTIPFYGPGHTIIGYTDDNRQFYPVQYSGAKNNQLNLQDKELLANPELLKKYVQSKDNYKFAEGGGIPERYRNMGFTNVGAKKQSTRPGKKWMVLAKKGDDYKVVHGGYKGMQDFKQHHSEQRKENFWSRMGGRNSSKATDPFSPLYWHKRFGTWEYGGQPMAVGGQNVMNPIVKKDNRNWLEYLKN